MRGAAAARRRWRWALLLAPFWGRGADGAAAFPPAALPAPEPRARVAGRGHAGSRIPAAGHRRRHAGRHRHHRPGRRDVSPDPFAGDRRHRGTHAQPRAGPLPGPIRRARRSGAARRACWRSSWAAAPSACTAGRASRSRGRRSSRSAPTAAPASRCGSRAKPSGPRWPTGRGTSRSRSWCRRACKRPTRAPSTAAANRARRRWTCTCRRFSASCCWRPDAVEAGSLSEVVVLGVDERGEPAAARTSWRWLRRRALAHPLGGGPGEARFLFEAPVRTDAADAGADRVGGRERAVARGCRRSAARGRRGPAGRRRAQRPTDRRRAALGADHDLGARPIRQPHVGRPVSWRTSTAAPNPSRSPPAGTAVFWLNAPAHYEGRERIDILVELGAMRAFKTVRVTGGAPAALTIHVAPGRVVADGRRGTELQVQAIDRNGTPTSVPGLSWETPEGRIRGVRVPRDGEYLAEYVPERTREAHRELVAVMASETVRAETLVDVTPPPIRVLVGAHAGLTTSFGPSVGPATLLEALVPIRMARVRVFAGLGVGYLRGDVTGRGVQGTGTTHVEVNQAPLLAVGRAGDRVGLRVRAVGGAGRRLVLGLGAHLGEPGGRRPRRRQHRQRAGPGERVRALVPAAPGAVGAGAAVSLDRPRPHVAGRSPDGQQRRAGGRPRVRNDVLT